MSDLQRFHVLDVLEEYWKGGRGWIEALPFPAVEHLCREMLPPAFAEIQLPVPKPCLSPPASNNILRPTVLAGGLVLHLSALQIYPGG